MDIDAWATAARADKWRQVDDHQQAITIIVSLLYGEYDASKTAARIADVYLARIKTLQGKLNMAPFWAIVCDAARGLGGDDGCSERLADLVIAMSRLPDVEDGQSNDGSPARNYAHRAVYWRDLPDFGMTFREYGAYLDGAEDDDIDFVDFKKQGPLYLNANRFAATLLARAPRERKFFYMDRYALNAIHSIVEFNPENTEPETRACVEMEVPVLAEWMRLAGPRLYELASDPSSSGMGSSHVQRHSMEGWSACRRALERVQRDGGMSVGCREWAGKGIAWMRETERVDGA